ncbi:hypothetical protein N7532_007518 [Penicillium argentinense]|uniref:Small EDRK-rich factor-like N-terminal domain-containing protein n=1 Tax=Penicillium argentinense TaxID=1131581 RepID=A0A9W9F840_9EURO|nr:uncharacterized protein N7532_007518 [Penicillium argentinense]KAJ5095227.1 hypothetical protein N7532_007518 [Penicillium argentinense]
MTRGNQRDTDRAKAQKKAASAVRSTPAKNTPRPLFSADFYQKSKNTMSGTQYQKAKEDAATIMREKQRKGKSTSFLREESAN